MDQQKDSFIFYRSYFESLQDLPEADRLKIYDAICDYSLNRTTPELSGVSKAIFCLIKPQIEANFKRYENGKRGGRPKENNQTETETKPKNNQTETETKPNKNVNENDNENVNENLKVNIKNNIDARKLKFAESIKLISHLYDRDLLNNFYKYWTEENKSGSKFKQELEKTWNLERRLETWASNDNKFKKQNNGSGIKPTAEQQIIDRKEEFFRSFDTSIED